MLPELVTLHLRERLRAHRQIRASERQNLNRMPEQDLLELAARHGIDVEGLLAAASGEPEHSDRHPAFQGTLQFHMDAELLGAPVKRELRADYLYVPDWEYFDLRLQQRHIGTERCSIKILIKLPEDRNALWETEPGVFGKLGVQWIDADLRWWPEAFYQRLEDQIDELCRLEDRKRREVWATRGRVKWKAPDPWGPWTAADPQPGAGLGGTSVGQRPANSNRPRLTPI
jgi:hypothetical protein